MSSPFNFTDNQWYNFICGFHAGLKLKDLTLPYVENDIVLYPIGVGGYGMIGIALPEIEYDGSTQDFKIPIYTHDVDINYSGFSIRLTFDNQRLRFNGVEAGDFGTIGPNTGTYDIRYSYSNGEFKARGMRDSSIYFNEPIILFYIDVTIIGNVTESTPIELTLDNSNNTSLNSTTLLTYVEVDGQFYSYFITPVKNISGKIVSNIEDQKEPLGEETGIAVSATPSGVFIGNAWTAPGNMGAVALMSNSNIEDEFPYNGVHLNFTVMDNPNLFTYLEIRGASGFTVSVDRSRDSDGHEVFDVYAYRDTRESDSCTFAYMIYQIADTGVTNYSIPLINNISELLN